VGASFHTGLVIPHYDAAPAFGGLIEPGMVFTIEPMLTMGTPERPGTTAWDEWPDEWTVTTGDRSLTAQFEHTLVVTERGAGILTLR
ncbi:MAG TPA: M24 family metallopeptidase, partial [Vicinamibacterales bacterium]|nr:M24 family metallopeptidase [Vicinamibacterales bacterium]